MEKIFFSPKYNKYNKYNDLIVNELENLNIKVLGGGGKSLIEAFFDRNVKIFHFNWIENVSRNSLLETLYLTIRNISLILILKLGLKKIIWTLHNKEPHVNNYRNLNKLMMKFMMKISDKIIIHSKEESLKCLSDYGQKDIKKIFFLKHGNYVNVYNDTDENFREKWNINSEDKVWMFLGSVTPYKNIEILIDAFESLTKNKNVKLIIAGKCSNVNYLKKITNRIKSSNGIIYINKFIEDSEIEQYFKTSDILVTPYDLRSSLNSGSIFLALSLKNLVISSKNGTVKELPEEFIYSYNYKTEEEHRNELMKAIERAIEDMENKKEFNLKKEEAFNLMKKDYDWNDIGKDLLKIYKH
jgi:glycosyltransferase involved in cell wall biosynthesis